MASSRTFVGFGFGAIQSGLFVFEARNSGSFSRYTVAEIDMRLVTAIRAAGGMFTVNVASRDGVRAVPVGPVEILNPRDPQDCALLIRRVADADEAATALPSVDFYGSGDHSVAWILAEGLCARTSPQPLVVYAAENHNRAAEILGDHVRACGADAPERCEFLNTVIGKMSGVIRGESAIRSLGLAPVVSGLDRAFLVEEFNRILVSRPARAERGITVFVEKNDLLPFEEAKLYGHNAAHALLAYLCCELGLSAVAEATRVPGVIPFTRAAFVEEAGAALIVRRGSVDPLFTSAGFAAYADDLLDRMTRPSLHDTVERVGRDPARKLGFDDRLIGTLRVCRESGIDGARIAFGAACALAQLFPDAGAQTDAYGKLCTLWGHDAPELRDPIGAAWRRFLAWRGAGRPDLTAFWNSTRR